MTQIIVYAGAIMVLFLFVVMLLNAPREDAPTAYGPSLVALTTGARAPVRVSRAWCWSASWSGRITKAALPPTPINRGSDGLGGIGARDRHRSLFTTHAFAFEVTSVLILVAMVGAVVLASKKQA